MIAHDHIGDLAPAIDQESKLSVQGARQFGELPGQFLGDDRVRRDAPPVELSESLLLIRPESGQMAMDFVDGYFLYNLSCMIFKKAWGVTIGIP